METLSEISWLLSCFPPLVTRGILWSILFYCIFQQGTIHRATHLLHHLGPTSLICLTSNPYQINDRKYFLRYVGCFFIFLFLLLSKNILVCCNSCWLKIIFKNIIAKTNVLELFLHFLLGIIQFGLLFKSLIISVNACELYKIVI